ncbi:purine-nucleoside phosphorylase [Polluticoccus soli]|uniref:purine-nucleoside phosphorylase n=1 Tax=Polluticoccus soli TaxID=3034150 RepID=UPI0023E337BB|nr:purine-nucleoside phosphorylase [Flavipsychrobacter sp. JY13-12]
MSLYERSHAVAAFLQEKTKIKPQVAIILGSGLGGLIDTVKIDAEIPYTDIPDFPKSTVEGHEGKMVFGTLAGKQVVMMAGRFHYYEGYSMGQITFPIRVFQALGTDTLILSNACGGMNAKYKIGDLMAIADHINLFPEHPLRGANDDRLGIRFPDMSEPYDKKLIQMALNIAKEQGLLLHTGVYAGLTGPTFETPAEYVWLARMGADVVGMSTVPETIVARHAQMRVFATSVITDLGGIDGHVEPITHEEVLEAANAAAPKLAALVTALVERM